MIKMGHRRKKKKKVNSMPNQANRNEKISNITQKINEETEKEKLQAIQQKNRENKLASVEKNIWHVFRIIGIIAVGIILVVTFLLLVWCIVLYCQGDNIIANIVVTVIQLITGILSLAVGVWALILTIQSNRNAEEIRSRNMSINTSYASLNPAGIRENDVNEDSLK